MMSGRWELRLASSTPRKTCFYKTTRVDQIVLSSNVERGLCGTVGLWDAWWCLTPHSIQVASVVVRINDMHASAVN